MSKKLKIIICLLSLSLSFSLLYLYITNKHVVNQINTNVSLREKVLQIDEFKSNITNMSSMTNYYIITQKESYRAEYNKNFTSALANINELYDSNYITKEDKVSLEDGLNKYNDLTNKFIFINRGTPLPITEDNKNTFLRLNDIKSNLMQDTSDVLARNIEISNSNSGTVINLVDNQNSLIQIIGGFITMILLSPLYFLKKNSTIITDLIKRFVSNHLKKDKVSSTISEEKKNNDIIKCDDKLIECINSGYLNNLETLLTERELMISNLKIIYSHNKYMKEEWMKSKESLDSIEHDLIDLKKQLNHLMNKSDIPYEEINVLENKLLKIRFLLEKLPEYHEFIMKLTEKY
ncbi:hypothetical protein [Clostridium sp. SM-530-WT-3G]|uniref:CHASE3 domain-containing protein n=1 Tax=Clostridium sp. SM-530-WT-3G TaxID=2725303 RepID=UPI00145C4744|nr:hypothetical protein [Clostridium sp. SM-530-WT-3G]NME82576.1 hypothetical protein [Clostridium sp. SM-530-WT-3G]